MEWCLSTDQPNFWEESWTSSTLRFPSHNHHSLSYAHLHISPPFSTLEKPHCNITSPSPANMASTQPSGPSITTIALATTSVLLGAGLAYAVYFDHRRRSDPEFRRNLKKQQKKISKLSEADAVAAERGQKERVKRLVDEANEEGFPRDSEETEQYFMTEVARGEQMCGDGSDPVDAALCFYRALKVYPQPRELIGIYDKTVPKVSVIIRRERETGFVDVGLEC